MAATAVWGVSFVVVKEGLAASTPLAFVALRFAIGAAALAPIVGWRPRFGPAELSAGALLAALLAGGFATQAVGLEYTTPSRSAFIVASSSVLAPVVAFGALGRRPGWWVGAALAVAALGIWLLTAPDAGGLNRGDVWTFATAVCFGAQIVAVAELSRRHDPARLVWLQVSGTAIATALAAWVLEPVRVSWTPGFGAALLYASVAATALALWWQMRAQRHMSSERAALLFCLEPVFAAIASWLWFAERLSATQWLGGGVILLALLLAELPASRRRGAVPAP